jgi:acid phosphatase (class A)
MTGRVTLSLTAFLASLLLTAVSGAVLAADPAAPPDAARPHASKALMALADDQIDPSRLLPAPPADGSERQKAELADVQRIYGSRTTERLAQAQWDNDHEDLTVFNATLGPSFDLTKLPATAKLLALVDNDQKIAAGRAKSFFKRTRPWALDPSIRPCDYKPNANPQTSYPSGHATLGYSVGYVLAALMPDKAKTILTRADDYAYSREVCGDHFPSDLEASHVLGTDVAIQILNKPEVAPMLAAARAELRAAQLTNAN